MKTSKLILLLALHTIIAIPIHDSRSSPETNSENDMRQHKEDLPEYMIELYQCWKRHKNEIDIKNCLASAGENSEENHITNSDTIIGFIGQSIETPVLSNAPQYQLISFNVSCIKDEETVYSSELRIHKSSITNDTIQSLKTNICPLNKGVNVSLLADIYNDGHDHVVQSVQLTPENLLSDDWIVFRDINPVLSQWKRSNNLGKNQTVKLVLQAGCASVHPSSIGIMQTMNSTQPLMVVFANSNNDAVKKKMFENFINKMPQATKEKRASHATSACKLHEYTVHFSHLGWSDFVITPPSYKANYCSGTCTYPISSEHNATFHTQIIAFSHFQNPQAVPSPCCVPTKLAPQSLIVKVDSTIQIKIFPDMIATECKCR